MLPNNKNIIMAAQQCVPLAEGKRVVVLPIEDVDKLSLLLRLGLRQAFQELIQFSVSTEKLVLRQGQIIPRGSGGWSCPPRPCPRAFPP